MTARITALLVVLLVASSCAGPLQPHGPAIRPSDGAAAHALKVTIVEDATGTAIDPTPLHAEWVNPVLSDAPRGASIRLVSNHAVGPFVYGTIRVDSSASSCVQPCVYNGQALSGKEAGFLSIGVASDEAQTSGMLGMGRAWNGTPPKVDTGDAVVEWMLPNGSPVVNLAAGSDRIGATKGSLNVYDKSLNDQLEGLWVATVIVIIPVFLLLVRIEQHLEKLAKKS